MTSLRSYLYYFLVALWTLVLGVIFSPLYVLGQQRWVYWLSVLWEWGLMFALRHIVGLSYRVTGYEHLAQPPYVLAIKHQSAFETLLLSIHFPNPAIILKKELLAIPLVG
ncbi:MAG: 1-acyl-sn-glycerol-3-phosphate acyltransferase, partial [Alphaproteobacteria bacterium]|nr:1-acyl-sn-glycerol-3-phosphate acyltransferase [Alphaproteobacteria bacterium]